MARVVLGSGGRFWAGGVGGGFEGGGLEGWSEGGERGGKRRVWGQGKICILPLLC